MIRMRTLRRSGPSAVCTQPWTGPSSTPTAGTISRPTASSCSTTRSTRRRGAPGRSRTAIAGRMRSATRRSRGCSISTRSAPPRRPGPARRRLRLRGGSRNGPRLGPPRAKPGAHGRRNRVHCGERRMTEAIIDVRTFVACDTAQAWTVSTVRSVWDAQVNAMNERDRRAADHGRARYRGTVRLMRDASVSIRAGTEQEPEGISLHQELELRVEPGLSSIRAGPSPGRSPQRPVKRRPFPGSHWRARYRRGQQRFRVGVA